MGEDEARKRRLRIEIEDLEYSVKGLNNRIDHLSREGLDKAIVQRKECHVKYEALREQQVQLSIKNSKQNKICNLLQANVLKLERQLDRLLNTTDVTEDELEEIHQGSSEVALIGQQNEDNEATEDENPFGDLTEVKPWPTHEILENTWAKLPDRFLIHFAHPTTIKEFLHMSWREVLSCPGDDEALFRRECLWRTALDVRLLLGNLEETAASSLQTNPDSKRLTLNPDISMCPYELQGECADPECTYQHTNPRPAGSIMARELIALPKLKLGKRRTQSKPSSKRQPGINPSSAAGHFSNDDDFVRLPPENITGEAAESNPEALFAWMEPAQGGTGSVYDLLGVTVKEDPESNRSYVDLQPGDPIQLFAAYQLTLHAGRHDLAAGIVDAYKELNSNDHYSDLLEIQEKTTLRDHKRNFFTRLFDTQLNLTLAYTVTEYESQNQEFTGGKSLIQKIVEQCFPRAPKNDTTFHSVSDRITAELKKTRQESAESHEFLFRLVEKCNTASSIRHEIQSNSSLDDVIGIILPIAEMAQGAAGSNDRQADFVGTWPLLTVIPVFAQTIFGALGCAARHFDETSNNNTELRSLVKKVDVMLGAFRRRFHDIFQTDLLLAPLYAANIALAATVRLYDKAHGCLENMLRDASIVESKVSRYFSGTLMPYSDILWSQMIQLRGALPKKLQASSLTLSSNDSLPTEHTEDSKAIGTALENLGVYPCHVVIRNDETIARIMNQLKSPQFNNVAWKTATISSFFSLHDHIHRVPVLGTESMDSIHFELKGHSLVAVECYKPTSSLMYAIPQSILLAGHVIESLDLAETGLQQLHPTFGTYFPNLKTLDLSDNGLTSLPQSIGRLASLQSLIVDRNRLKSLPRFRLKQLEILSAVENNLQSIPETIGECAELKTVDFSGNRLDAQFYLTMSKLPKLVSFKPEKSQMKSSIKRTTSTGSKPGKKVRFTST